MITELLQTLLALIIIGAVCWWKFYKEPRLKKEGKV